MKYILNLFIIKKENDIMSEERNVIKSVNKVQIAGTFKESNLVYDPNAENSRNPKIKGAIVKKDFSHPSITIDVNGTTVEVDFMPTYEKKEDNGKLVDNANFKALKRIVDGEFVSGETRVFIDNGKIVDAGYVNKDFEFKDKVTVQSFGVKTSDVPEKDFAEVKLTGVVRNIKNESYRKGDETINTGRKIVDFYFVDDDFKSGGLVTIPINLVVADEDLVDEIDDFCSAGDNVSFQCDIVSRVVGGEEKTKKHAFGHKESQMIQGYRVQEYVIGAGDLVDEEASHYIEMDDMKKLMNDRRIMTEARIGQKKNAPKKTADTPKKGLGSKASSMTTDVDDEDSPF
jgi:hypothetical protein